MPPRVLASGPKPCGGKKNSVVNVEIIQGRVTFITNVGRVALIFRTNEMIECNAKC